MRKNDLWTAGAGRFAGFRKILYLCRRKNGMFLVRSGNKD